MVTATRCGECDVSARVSVVREDPTVPTGGAVGFEGERVAVNRDGKGGVGSGERNRNRCCEKERREVVTARGGHRTSIRTRRGKCASTDDSARRRDSGQEIPLFRLGGVFQQVFEFLVELFNLRADHELAVLLSWVRVEIVLVILLGGEEVFDRRDLGDDRRFERARFVELLFVLLRRCGAGLRCDRRSRSDIGCRLSWPWRLSVVGSWVCQKTFNRSSNLISLGSYVIWMTSAWPVRPVQTCS